MSIELLIILVLILFNGLFVGTELAILGAKRGRLEEQAQDGHSGARTALQLQDNPGRFLSSLQFGVTLIGILIGAFAGTTFAEQMAAILQKLPYLANYADQLALVLVVILIAYVTLVFGQLVPRRIALIKAESYATLVAPPLNMIARLFSPIVSLLTMSSQLVLRMLGLGHAPAAQVTEEDIRALVREGAQEGTVEPEEQQFIESIFKFSDRAVRHIMTPRRDVEMLEADATLGTVLDELLESGYSRFPVYEESQDQIVGIVHVRDLLMLYRRAGDSARVREVIAPPLYVPENSRASLLLATFRKGRRHMAIVVGELGGIEGVITLEDVLEEIVGEIDDEFDEASPEPVIRCEDGSLLAEGSLSIDEVKSLLDVDELPDEDTYRYDTLAGLVIALLGRIPTTGDVAEWDEWRFEVVDMDGLRVDKVLISTVDCRL
ncbi:hemolysin family protein [Candidatus Viridilinea mediisalina]|uniref:Hemolysin n=1 Tax=Candidatus Viridilinea mediisalina TaxID=2024553 RepID=A0A2A6RHQ5_9CHLR|nr:hemolysin family protein [Candidatus Viridilinea mediisalina]PDW02415.1 hypothetical protein CJ255_14185 [Candidatus Viridilinea mediisalina]